MPHALCFVGQNFCNCFSPAVQKSRVIELVVLTGELEECSDCLLPPLWFLRDEGQFNQTQEEDQLASSQGYCGHQIAWPHHVKLHLRGQKKKKNVILLHCKSSNGRFLESYFSCRPKIQIIAISWNHIYNRYLISVILSVNAWLNNSSILQFMLLKETFFISSTGKMWHNLKGTWWELEKLCKSIFYR